jgi:hypothetical protein
VLGVRAHPDEQLDHEEPEDQPVGETQLLADRGIDRVVRLEAERHRVDGDDPEHQRVEPRRFDDPSAARGDP